VVREHRAANNSKNPKPPRFIIADITSPRSIPQELQATVPNLEVPFVPLLSAGQKPYGLFADLAKYPWVLPIQTYQNTVQLKRLFPNLLLKVNAKIREIGDSRKRIRKMYE
jgi:hypothetical protein